MTFTSPSLFFESKLLAVSSVEFRVSNPALADLKMKMTTELILLCLALGVVKGSGLDPPTVHLGDLGSLVGKEIKTIGNPDLKPKTYYTFRNIPYAKPITQENRFSV